MPLDETAPPCMLMQMMPEHKAAGWTTPIWDTYKDVVRRHEPRDVEFVEIERFAFYERAKSAFCVVATGCVQDPARPSPRAAVLGRRRNVITLAFLPLPFHCAARMHSTATSSSRVRGEEQEPKAIESTASPSSHRPLQPPLPGSLPRPDGAIAEGVLAPEADDAGR